MTKRCLVFAAHPDDETNGVGGTLLHLRDRGWHIHIVYATLPEAIDLKEARSSACWDVCGALGASFETWGFPDAKLETCMKAAHEKAVLTYGAVNPDLVLVMHPADVHPDHRAMASIGMGPALQKGVNTEIFTYELCSSGRHTDGDRPQTLGFIPTHYVDTTSVIEGVAVLQRFHDTEDPEAMIRGMKNVHGNRAKEFVDEYTPRRLYFEGKAFKEAFVRLTRFGSLRNDLESVFEKSPYMLPRRIGVDFKPETIGL